MRGGRGNGLPVDLDARVLGHARAQRGDQRTIDANATFGDHLFGAATRRHAAVRHHLLQTDHVELSPTGSRSPMPGIAPSGVRARGSSSRLDRPKHSRNSQVVP
jgi:hypothetical protein